MDAHLSLRRIVTCAGLAALVTLASSCGGGSGTQPAAKTHDPPLVQYSNSVLSFTHPTDWKTYPFHWAGGLHFRPLVYLSTQPVHDPCSTKGSTTSCGFPIGKLRPGGVLVTWNASNPPSFSLGSGTPVRVGGHPARQIETKGGICKSIGADRTIDVLVQTHPLPSSLTEFTACLRGPGLSGAERSVDSLLASTQFTSH